MKDNLCNIYLVRHGQTDWNVAGRIQGHADIPLNTHGKGQASELAAKLAEITFDKVFSSDLLRAKETAEIIVLKRKLAVVTTQVLRERAFGSFEGKLRHELKEIDEALEKLDKLGRKKFSYKNEVESDETLVNRLIPFLREVAVGNPGKNILMVAHSGVINTLLRHINDEEMRSASISNTGYIKIVSDGVVFEIAEAIGVTYD